ncbi:MAG: hypothetical protein RLZZ522_258 [Verrucomicrobiota bacterium]
MSPVAISPFIPSSPPPVLNPDFSDLVESCLERTAAALLSTCAASESEVSHALDAVHRAGEEGLRLDLLQAVAASQGFQEEQVGSVIVSLAEKISVTLNPVPPLVPFAGKLIAPSAFYESFTQLYQTAMALLTPVIFVEDTDAIGVASINPIAAELLAECVQNVVFRRFGIRPFLTVARIDYESWCFLTRKHF